VAPVGAGIRFSQTPHGVNTVTSDFQGTFYTHDLAFVLNDTPVAATLALLPISLVGLLVVRPRRNDAR
jgi:hypothetical protein